MGMGFLSNIKQYTANQRGAAVNSGALPWDEAKYGKRPEDITDISAGSVGAGPDWTATGYAVGKKNDKAKKRLSNDSSYHTGNADYDKRAEEAVGGVDWDLGSWEGPKNTQELNSVTYQLTHPEGDSKPQEPQTSAADDIAATMKQWEEIFGEDNKKALAGANQSLDSEISANTRRQAELNAMSGRSATGGGYQAGAAQAALSAGASRGQLESNFYQFQAKQKNDFLQRMLDRANQAGQFDKAKEIELAMAQLGLLGDIGETNASTTLLNGTQF